MANRRRSSSPIDINDIHLEELELTPEEEKERNEQAWNIFKEHQLQKLKNRNEFHFLKGVEPEKISYDTYVIPFKLKDDSEYIVKINRYINWFDDDATKYTPYKPINERRLIIYIYDKLTDTPIISLSISNSYREIEISHGGSIISYYYWNALSSINKQQIIKACMIIIRKYFNPKNLFSVHDYREFPPFFNNLYPLTINPPVVFMKQTLLPNRIWSPKQRIQIKDYVTQLKEEQRTETPEEVALNVAKRDAYLNYLRTREWNEAILGPKLNGGSKKRKVTKKK